MEISRQLRQDLLNKRGLAPIQLTICWDGHRVRVGSGERCRPEHWDGEAKRVKSVKGSYYNQINPKLAALEEAAETALHAAEQAHERLSKPALQRALEPVLHPERTALVGAAEPLPAPLPPTFLELMDQWIDEYRRKIHPTTYRSIAQKTIEGLTATRNRFAQFAAAKGQPLTLPGMDNDFHHAFRVYLMDELGQQVNTFGKHISRLRTFLAWCEDHDYVVNRRYRKFIAPSVYVGVDALTEPELRALQQLDFAGPSVRARLTQLRGAPAKQGRQQLDFEQWVQQLELARDKFLVCAYTGLRISDADLLAWRHVKGQLIELKAGKNQHTCYIPFFDDDLFHLVALARQYEHRTTNGLLLPKCTHVNELLEIVQQLAGLQRLNLTTKLGRKTFVTLKLYQGIPSRLLMQATGHTTEQSFNRYVGVDTIKLLQEFMRKAPRSVA